MANPEHVKQLKKGIENWNLWISEQRKQDPAFRADLTGINLSDDEWKETPLWDENDRIIKFFVGDRFPTDGLGYGADFENVDFNYSKMSGALIGNANGKNAGFALCDLRNCVCNLGNFQGANFSNSDITGFWFSYCHLHGAAFHQVIYERKKMRGRYLSPAGIDDTHGHEAWKRDAKDQAYIDQLYNNLRVMLYQPGQDIGFWTKLRRMPQYMISRKGLFVWSLFDYGRSVTKTCFLAIFLMILFGFLFSQVSGEWIEFTSAAGSYSNNSFGSLLKPYYSSIVLFMTLGLADVVYPINYVGQIFLIVHVVLGYLILALLVAVLQSKFARRS